MEVRWNKHTRVQKPSQNMILSVQLVRVFTNDVLAVRRTDLPVVFLARFDTPPFETGGGTLAMKNQCFNLEILGYEEPYRAFTCLLAQ